MNILAEVWTTYILGNIQRYFTPASAALSHAPAAVGTAGSSLDSSQLERRRHIHEPEESKVEFETKTGNVKHDSDSLSNTDFI